MIRNELNNQVILKGSLCEGRCKEGPNISIDGVAYDHVDRSTIIDILGHHLKNTATDNNASAVIVKGTGNE